MAWRLMSWDLADYLLVVGSVPSVPPLPGEVSVESFFDDVLIFSGLKTFSSRIFFGFLI